MAEELRFIQITTSATTPSAGPVVFYLFGLTSDGLVYQYLDDTRGWVALSMTKAERG